MHKGCGEPGDHAAVAQLGKSWSSSRLQTGKRGHLVPPWLFEEAGSYSDLGRESSAEFFKFVELHA